MTLFISSDIRKTTITSPQRIPQPTATASGLNLLGQEGYSASSEKFWLNFIGNLASIPLVMGFFFTLMAMQSIVSGQPVKGINTTYMFLATVALNILSFFIICWFYRKKIGMVKARRWGNGQVLLSKQKIYAGDRISIEFQRLYNHHAGLEENVTVHAYISCAETTEVTRGTDYDHPTNRLWTEEFAPQTVYSGGKTVQARWQVTLPAHLPPQQIGEKHWIIYQLEVWEVSPKAAERRANFLLPVMARR